MGTLALFLVALGMLSFVIMRAIFKYYHEKDLELAAKENEKRKQKIEEEQKEKETAHKLIYEEIDKIQSKLQYKKIKERIYSHKKDENVYYIILDYVPRQETINMLKEDGFSVEIRKQGGSSVSWK